MTIADQIAALQNAPVAELAARYAEVFGHPPRSRRNAAWLRKRVAHKLQENAYGGLPRVAHAALDRLVGEIQMPADAAPVPVVAAKASAPRVLTREWHGATYRVVTGTDGYEWDGRSFGSLSAVAFAITGAKWNGKLFFGLTERGAKA